MQEEAEDSAAPSQGLGMSQDKDLTHGVRGCSGARKSNRAPQTEVAGWRRDAESAGRFIAAAEMSLHAASLKAFTCCCHMHVEFS